MLPQEVMLIKEKDRYFLNASIFFSKITIQHNFFPSSLWGLADLIVTVLSHVCHFSDIMWLLQPWTEFPKECSKIAENVLAGLLAYAKLLTMLEIECWVQGQSLYCCERYWLIYRYMFLAGTSMALHANGMNHGKLWLHGGRTHNGISNVKF